MRRVCALALVVAVAIPTTAFAHGVVGDYIFLEPLITQDPTPANELDILAPALDDAVSLLAPGGRAVVLAYQTGLITPANPETG